MAVSGASSQLCDFKCGQRVHHASFSVQTSCVCGQTEGTQTQHKKCTLKHVILSINKALTRGFDYSAIPLLVLLSDNMLTI